MATGTGVRRPVYIDPAELDRRTGVSYTRPVKKTPDRTITIPSVEDFSAALQRGSTTGMFGGPTTRFDGARVPEGYQQRWDQTINELRNTREFYDRQRAEAAAAEAAVGGGGGGPSRQQLIDEAFGNLPEYAGYMPEADMQALADYYGGQRSTLENVYAAQRGRIGDVSAQTLAALSAIDPQAAFVYDVGGPTIPDVEVDYLRALGASADPVSAEAEFSRNILGYQLNASQRAAEGMAASLERERQARLAASRLMEQEGYTRAEQARAAALADLAARQAREEAVIRERVRLADEERARRDAELAQLRLEFELAGLD
jgi:hypothetical protein